MMRDRPTTPRRRRLTMLAVGALGVIAVTLGAAAAASAAPTWTNAAPPTSPSARGYSSMAYDARHGQLLLFGGYDGHAMLTGTWRWTGSTWMDLAPVKSPSHRDAAALGYDAATKQLILFGGYTYDSVAALHRDTWLWTGTTWRKLAPKKSPPKRFGAAMAYDAASKQLLLFGGLKNTQGGFLNDTWVWTGSTWKRLFPRRHPPAVATQMTYDPRRKRIVLFGDTMPAATWLWNGKNWSKRTTSTAPHARYGSTLTFDPALGKVILFGGVPLPTGYPVDGLADTWAWNGTSWTRLTVATAPPGRTGAAAAYDRRTKRLVLFGGFDRLFDIYGDGSVLGDTWTFAG